LRLHQPMTKGLALHVHWSFHQKLNRVSVVRLCRSVQHTCLYINISAIQYDGVNCVVAIAVGLE